MTKFLFSSLILLFAFTSFGQGFLHTDGTKIVDGNGNNFIARSIGTGNWMIQEGYMMKSTDAGINTQWQFRKKLTETIGEAKADSFYNVWLANHFTRTDVDSMKVWGFNALRPALHYKWFTLPIEEEPVVGQNTWLEDGFQMLDSLVAWCHDNQMYVMLDMHGTPGGQGKNADISDYNPSKPSLWESEQNRAKLVALWYKIAERYKDEPYIGGFDLINETNWDFEKSGNENGCNCNQNQPLKKMFERLIDTIRLVNNNHIIYISGNCWGNNYGGLYTLANYDDNLAYTFHKYWNYNDENAVDWIKDKADQYDVPVWMSESGENSNTWFTNAITIFEKNNIGWSWWPVKKSGINNILNVTTNEDYSNLIKYWKSGTPQMTQDQVFQAVLTWADNHKIENCKIQYDVIDALIRQVNSYEAIPFKKHVLGNNIAFTDYDLGRNNVAYADTDTANYHVTEGTYTSWNAGWAYRNDGVDIEACTDTQVASGYNVGWTSNGEWMQYTLTTDSAASYTLTIRHASGSSGSKMHIEVNNVDVSGTLTLAGTGGWQKWETATFENVILPAGELKIKVVIDQGGSNLNFFAFTNPKDIAGVGFEFVSAETTSNDTEINVILNKEITTPNSSIALNDFIVKINTIATNVTSISKQVSSTVLVLTIDEKLYADNAVTVTYNGVSVKSGTQNLTPFFDKPVKNSLPFNHTIPGKIQAEAFSYNNGLVLETCEDAGAGKNTGYSAPGDYLDYRVHSTKAGSLNVNYRVATTSSNSELVFLVGEGDSFTPLDTIRFTSTGGWQTWKTQSSVVNLNEGYYTIRLLVKQGEHNLNWFEITEPNGIDATALKTNFSVYPNPAHNFVMVNIHSKVNEPATIKVYNVMGKLMMQTMVTETENKLNTAEFNKGIYFIQVENSAGSYSQKLIIE